MKIFRILLLFLIFTECSDPKIPKKNTESYTPVPNNTIPDSEVPNSEVPDGKEIYKIFPFPESLKNSKIENADYNNFVKRIENFYDSKRNEINESLRKNPVETLKKLLPRSNDQAIDAIYSKCLLESDRSTVKILDEMFGNYKSINDNVKKSRRKEIIEWFKRENIVPAPCLCKYLFPELREDLVPCFQFYTNLDPNKTISTPSEKILNKIKSEIVPLNNGIYCISLCPYCGHTIYRYEKNLLRCKYHHMAFVTSVFDQEKMKLKCHNADCVAYDKVIISEWGISVIILKDIIVNLEIKKSGDFPKTLEINGIKCLNPCIMGSIFNGVDVIITRISE